MVDKEKVEVWSKIIKEGMTHLISLALIIPLVILLYKSATDQMIKIPELLISLGSGAVGYYLGRFVHS